MSCIEWTKKYLPIRSSSKKIASKASNENQWKSVQSAYVLSEVKKLFASKIIFVRALIVVVVRRWLLWLLWLFQQSLPCRQTGWNKISTTKPVESKLFNKTKIGLAPFSRLSLVGEATTKTRNCCANIGAFFLEHLIKRKSDWLLSVAYPWWGRRQPKPEIAAQI